MARPPRTLTELAPPPREQHCITCGKTAPTVQFRSPGAFKCMSCDQKTLENRKEYHRLYHKARGRAIKRLTDKYARLFDQMMQEELSAVEREEREEAEEA